MDLEDILDGSKLEKVGVNQSEQKEDISYGNFKLISLYFLSNKVKVNTFELVSLDKVGTEKCCTSSKGGFNDHNLYFYEHNFLNL